MSLEKLNCPQVRENKSPPILIDGRHLVRNLLWNLTGEGTPMAAALISVPIMMRVLGIERFGILTLVWAFVGYFGIFDMGLGRALTKLAADKIAIGAYEELKALFWTAFCLMLAFGLLGGLALAAACPWFARHALNTSASLRPEVRGAFYVLALSLPVVITQAAFRGLLSALQRFDLINAIRIPMGALFFLAPLMVLPFSRSLVAVVAVLLSVRLIGWAALLCACLRAVAGLARPRPSVSFAGPLLSFGGWITGAAIPNQLMAYAGHFIIGAVLSTMVVSYYTTPYEIVVRLYFIPAAIAGVLFPAFTEAFATGNSPRTAALLDRGGKYILMILFVPMLLLVVFARDGLSLWLNSSFAEHGTRVLQLLAAGVLISGAANVPYALIQAAHRPDLIAKLHLCELPFYFALLWCLTLKMGVDGTALAYTLRVVGHSAVLFLMAVRLSPSVIFATYRTGVLLFVILGVLALGALLPNGVWPRALFSTVACAGGLWIGWGFFLSPSEHEELGTFFQPLLQLIAIK